MTGTLFRVDQGRVLGTSPDSGQRTSRHLMMSRNIIPGEILSAIKLGILLGPEGPEGKFRFYKDKIENRE